MGVIGQLYASLALPPRKEPWYPLDRSWVDPRACLDVFGEEKDLATVGDRTPERPVHSIFTIPTTLFRLHTHLYCICSIRF